MAQIEMIKDGHLGGFVAGGDPGTWCPSLWRWAVERLGIRSVLDVGCGEGHSTKFFRELGCDVLGVEGSPLAIENSVIRDAVVLHDYCHGPFIPDRPFDLVWSCEFLEHVEERYLPNILRTFTFAQKAVMVTHAFPGQRGHHHVNLKPTRYWISRIEPVGLECHVALTRQARTTTLADYPGINHFARSGLLFTRPPHMADKVGQIALPARPAGLQRMKDFWQASRKAMAIQSVRLSPPYRQQRRRRRAEKRARQQSLNH